MVAGPPALVAGGASAPAPSRPPSRWPIAFPEGGSFPFVASSFWPALAASIAVGLVIPRDARVVRIGVALYAVAIVASFALATPMGGNVVRLGALFAGPVLAALVWRTNRRALALLALPLLYWQWVAPVDDWARAAGDASVHERYYDGLLGFLGTQRGGPSAWRSRSPTTTGSRAGWRRTCRWRADGSARSTASATRSSMTAVRLPPARYRRWLDDNAVRFVALADAPIDYSAAREAQLVRDGTAVPARGLARRALARLRGRRRPSAGRRRGARDRGRARARAPDGRAAPALVDLRVRFTPYWRIATGRGCVARGTRRLDAAARRAPRTGGPRDLVRPRTGARERAAMHG